MGGKCIALLRRFNTSRRRRVRVRCASCTIILLEARIVTESQEYVLSKKKTGRFDDSKQEVIERVTASGDLVVEGLDQEFKCASACFGHYMESKW